MDYRQQLKPPVLAIAGTVDKLRTLVTKLRGQNYTVGHAVLIGDAGTNAPENVTMDAATREKYGIDPETFGDVSVYLAPTPHLMEQVATHANPSLAVIDDGFPPNNFPGGANGVLGILNNRMAGRVNGIIIGTERTYMTATTITGFIGNLPDMLKDLVKGNAHSR